MSGVGAAWERRGSGARAAQERHMSGAGAARERGGNGAGAALGSYLPPSAAAAGDLTGQPERDERYGTREAIESLTRRLELLTSDLTGRPGGGGVPER